MMNSLQVKIFKPILEWDYTSAEGKKFYQVVTSIEDQLNAFLIQVPEDTIYGIRYYSHKDPKNNECMLIYRVEVSFESDLDDEDFELDD